MANEQSSESDRERERFTEALNAMSKAMGLRETFITELIGEKDDWSFVIKLHALLESTVCTLLASHLDRDELDDFLAEEIEMAKRVKMLSALGIGTSDQRRMMLALGKLRNKLVHNVEQTEFQLASLLNTKEKLLLFIETYTMRAPAPSDEETVRTFPRVIMWFAVLEIVSLTLSEKKKAITRAARRGLRRALLEEMKNE